MSIEEMHKKLVDSFTSMDRDVVGGIISEYDVELAKANVSDDIFDAWCDWTNLYEGLLIIKALRVPVPEKFDMWISILHDTYKNCLYHVMTGTCPIGKLATSLSDSETIMRTQKLTPTIDEYDIEIQRQYELLTSEEIEELNRMFHRPTSSNTS